MLLRKVRLTVEPGCPTIKPVTATSVAMSVGHLVTELAQCSGTGSHMLRWIARLRLEGSHGQGNSQRASDSLLSNLTLLGNQVGSLVTPDGQDDVACFDAPACVRGAVRIQVCHPRIACAVGLRRVKH